VTDELAYGLITPYSLYKSRTGGIIGRMLARPDLQLVAMRMFVLSDAFIDEYMQIICPPRTDPATAEAWKNYLDTSLRQDQAGGFLPRCMLLLFKGPNAVRRLKDEIIGGFTEQPVGDTVRGTFGDFVRDATGAVRYFEPAVITCPDPKVNREHLRLFARYALSDGGVLTGRVRPEEYGGRTPEVSLVILKPDNFYRPSRRPGNIIDTFSLTGLKIVAARLFTMTVAQGEQFYGPLKGIFREKLRFLVANTISERLSGAFDFPITDDDADKMADLLAERNAACEFNRIVEYMTGVHPDSIAPADKAAAGEARCLALLYEGPGAIEKIRAVLGSTDPSKAEPGTVRSDFGLDLMRNGAHASDSVENAMRERKIVGLVETESDTCDLIEIIKRRLA